QALEQLAQELEQAAQFERALSYAVRAVNTDPLREEVHRTVMRLYAAMAEPWAALRHYDELIAILKQELDAAPSAPTQALAREIARLVSEEDESVTQRAPGSARVPTQSAIARIGTGFSAAQSASHPSFDRGRSQERT